jgi:hypothetical protein
VSSAHRARDSAETADATASGRFAGEDRRRYNAAPEIVIQILRKHRNWLMIVIAILALVPMSLPPEAGNDCASCIL